MTTKETEIPTIFYKKKKKQIYKITVLNIFTGFVFICKRIFNLKEAQCDKGDEGKQGSFFTMMTSQSQVPIGQQREEKVRRSQLKSPKRVLVADNVMRR